MAAVTQDITAEQGAALAVTLTGAGASLQGRTLRMHVRSKVGVTTTKLVASTTDGRLAVGANPYTTATLAIDADIMAAVSITLPTEYWVYDVESYTTAADVRREWSGRFTITRDVTRDTEATAEASLSGAVLYSGPQSLTTAQQDQAWDNIGGDEAARDAVGAALVAGSNVTITVSDVGDTITIAATGGGGGGSGDVVGPASATDDRIAAFDGVTGKLIKQGGVTATAVASHLGSTSNPHSVTAAQVGADATGTAAAAVVAHAGATDPHGDRAYADGLAGNYAAAGHNHSGTYQPLATVLTNTTASFTTADETKLDAIEALADVTDAGNVGTAIDGATAKSTPVDADTVALIDSAAGNVLKSLSWANIKATAKTYFDTLYAAIAHTHNASAIDTGTLDAARLPAPTTTALGGVKRNTGSAGQFVTGIDTDGSLLRDTPAGGGGSGDVVGPASATDNAIARYDTTTGKLLQNSSATLADSGALSLPMEDAGTNTVLFPLKVTRTSSGTPANGIGVGHQFEVETTAGNNEIGATLTAEVTDVTAASEDFALVVKTMVAGSTTLVEGGRFVGAQFRAVDGSVSAPSVSFSSGGVGFYYVGGVAAFSAAASMQYYFNSGETRFRQSYAQNYMASGASVGGTVNASFAHAGDNAFVFSDSANPVAGTAKSRQEKNKQVTAIADATATTVFTVTVPNAAHSASIKVMLVGSIGAGGAIGANEATGTVAYDIAIARTAGVNAVATISAAYGSVTSAVAGATTITVTGDLGAVSGAVGASNTFTIRVTITKGGGSSANHTCMAYARIVNANATGITII